MSEFVLKALPRLGVTGLKRPGLFPVFFFILLLMIVSLFYVWSRSQVTQLEYEISAKEGQVRSLKQEMSKFDVEIASLRDLKRIEGIALSRLDLHRAVSTQVKMVN